MVKYLIHCSEWDNVPKILEEHTLRTCDDLHKPCLGKGDVVYFSFYNPKTFRDQDELKNNYEDKYIQPCILLKIKDVIRKYKYFFISQEWDYGIHADKLSSTLHHMVQHANNINHLGEIISADKKMSQQCKTSLLHEDRLELLWEFKDKDNLSIKKFIEQNQGYFFPKSIEGYEICFLENINFKCMEYKLIHGKST